MIITSLTVSAQQTLWVGQSYNFDVTSSVMGITANVSWSTNGGYLSLSGSGFYRTITVTQYFSGTATVTCEWDYKLTGNGSYTHTKRQVTISCRDNQVSISPTSLTLSPGESKYVIYDHQYDNQYTSAANAYFQSTNPSVCTVSSSGEVIAKTPGTAYINVYSKISSVSPYCKVTVRQIEPTSVSIPSSMSMTVGESHAISPIVYPSNAQTTYSWSSSDSQIASVSSGTITAKKPGIATITVTTANGLSSSCKLTVNKAKLSISPSHVSQLLQLGTAISLSASAPNSTIYYTIDGETPSSKSLKYVNPIVITKSTTIKAYAVNDDYLDSDILTLNYDVTDLQLDYTIPQDKSQISWTNFVYTVAFNKNIRKSECFNDIKVFDENGNEIQLTVSVLNNTLNIVSATGFKYGKYKIQIPSFAVRASDNGSPNVFIGHSFVNKEQSLKIVAFDANGAHSFVVKEDGSLWAFGSNDDGELGDGTKVSKFQPVKIMDDVLMPVAGWNFGLAIKQDNSLWSWGSNYGGCLGDGTNTQRLTPQKIRDNIIYAEANQWSCGRAIDSDGNLWTWGKNEYGNLGDGTSTDRFSPVKILSDNIVLSSGGPHSAAISANNDLYTWGNNSDYNLGDGTTNYQKRPIKVKSGIRDVALAYCSTIVLDTNDDVWSWGNNGYGQLGTGNYKNSTLPQKILENIEKLCEFFYGCFAINKNHELYAWGNLGSLHWNTLGNSVTTPSVIMQDVEDVKCAYSHALIKKTDGSLWGVGVNYNGELGIKTDATIVNEPVLIFPGPSPAIQSLSPIFNEIDIEVGDNGYLPFVIQPFDAGISSIEWHTSNDCIAMNENGLFIAKKTGSSDIICTLKDTQNNIFNFIVKVNVIERGSFVEKVSVDDMNVRTNYYNLNGVKVNQKELRHGFYIKKQGALTEKVIVK